MFNNVKIPFIYYDLETCNITHLAIDERSAFANCCLPIPINDQCSNITMYKSLFPLTPNMNSFNDLSLFPTTWF